MRINKSIQSILGVVCMAPACGSVAGETISYEAEHVLESLMNARYLALPSIPDRFDDNELRLQTGFNQVSATSFNASALMLGLEYFLPDSSSSGYLFSLFGDFQQFHSNNGSAVFEPAFIKNAPFPVPLDVFVTGVNGHAEHYGISVSRARAISETKSWQYGLVVEYFDVGKFAVSFDSVGLDNNFSAVVDYAKTYAALTPYISYQQRFPVRQSRLKYSARVIATWPVPRRGFYGRLRFDGFDESGVGAGKHIPDAFAGIGFSIEQPEQRWKIDIGASLYYLLAEGSIHKGVSRPLFVSVSWGL